MKISVVVPIYNVEKYLIHCVESIQQQTYQNLEIILVDDGATDHSGEICNTLAANDGRIVVIHKLNGGLSDARNVGMEAATGEYICFIDSDDWIEPDTLQRAAEAIIDSDIVIWGFRKDTVDENENVLSFVEQKTTALLNKVDGYQILLQPGVMEIMGYAWNKLYRTQQLKQNDCRFEKGLSLVEDTVFNFPLYLHCESIKIIDYVGTHYIQRKRTTLGTAYYPNRMELKLRVAELMRILLLGFGAPPNVAEIEYEQFIAFAFRSTIRSIAQLNVSYRVKRKKMREMVTSDTTKDALQSSKAKRMIDQIILLSAKFRWLDILILIEGRKR